MINRKKLLSHDNLALNISSQRAAEQEIETIFPWEDHMQQNQLLK